ncbi:GAF and ANTAR domain-containing protein [Streptomyces sp. Q6]|uniref:GAF and ANTAR domain-containing protein n=1 Tax=Streptomyces citrinus TaxID=3118173 RepID=A0ACD5ADE5_9ACTN
MTLQERELAELFVQLARDAATDPVDTQALLVTLVRNGGTLPGVRGAAVQYAPGNGLPVHTAGTDSALHALVADAVAWQEGPAHDATTNGRALADVDLATTRWPRWTPRARHLGYGRLASLPLHMNDEPVGALLLLGAPGHPLDARALAVARSLAETFGHILVLTHEVFRSRTLARQLQHALTSRVVVEQAKGILAARHGLPLTTAFDRLRHYARSHQRKVEDVARAITEGSLDL